MLLSGVVFCTYPQSVYSIEAQEQKLPAVNVGHYVLAHLKKTNYSFYTFLTLHGKQSYLVSFTFELYNYSFNQMAYFIYRSY